MTRDRGAVSVIVAAFLPVAVLMLAFVVDLGALRAERVATSTAADAASLAAAATVDPTAPHPRNGSRPCASVRSTDPAHANVQRIADHYWQANGGTGSPTCTVTWRDDAAHVTVAGSRSVDYAFAAAIGQHSGTVAASSSAATPTTAPDGPLLPLAICGQPSRTAVAPGGVTEHSIIRYSPCGITARHRQVNYSPGPGPACGRAGRWCYDLNRGGWPGTVPARVTLVKEKWTPTIPALSALVASGDHFWVLAGRAIGPGYTTFDASHFVEVQLLSYASKQYMETRVFAVAPYSPAGPPPLSTAPTDGVRLCATTADTSGCTTTNGVDPR